MYARSIIVVAGFLLVGLGATCRGQAPFEEVAAEEATIDQLRREVAELKKTVAELRERLQPLEYQRLPRMKSEVLEVPIYAEPAGPLRFPIEIERANFPPPWLPLRRPMR